MKFTDALFLAFIEAGEMKNIKEYDSKFATLTTSGELEQAIKLGLTPEFIEFYKTQSNGVEFYWWKDEEKGVGGAMKLNRIKFLLRNEPSIVDECDMDPEMDQELRCFRILDTPTMNSQVGFFALPNQKIGKSIHFRMTGDKWTDDLDLDFKGYLEMALASKIYFNWQLVIVDIKNGKESKETKTFKQNIVTAFPDFKWAEFVNKYNNLRLSKV